MVTSTAPIITAPFITAFQAQAQASGFLSDRMPDRFCTGQPHFDYAAQVWRVPVLLSYAILGPVGQVGEVVVSANTKEVISATTKEAMMAAARALYEQHRDAIEAPVP